MRTVLTADEMRRALRRMAHEVLERNHGADRLVVLGIRTRGVPLAERLAAAITDIEDTEVAAGSLDVTLYRDDYAKTGPRPLGRTRIPGGIDDRVVVLVDDVLYTGRTIRAAMDAVADYGRPEAIQLAVLVDRGHRELPIRADYVGKNLPTSQRDAVRVRLTETDGADEVLVGDAAGRRDRMGAAGTRRSAGTRGSAGKGSAGIRGSAGKGSAGTRGSAGKGSAGTRGSAGKGSAGTRGSAGKGSAGREEGTA